MANSFGAAFRSFWHTMTSNDRHSSYDSPHRSGRHVQLNRQSTLTSVATANESRADITSPYTDDSARLSTAFETSYGGAGMPIISPSSPSSNGPYSPGLRSMNAKSNVQDGFETVSSPGEIPMQNFADGLPPAPPVTHSWKRIDAWAEENYPELFDQLGEGCTTNDLNELEHQLDCSLPQDVRDSLAVHDGQERGGNPTGIIFSSMLLDCEEIVQEWDQWRKVNQQYLLDTSVSKPAMPLRTFSIDGNSNNPNAAHGSNQASSSRSAPVSPAGSQTSSWKQELLEKQDCVPHGAVQRAYAHPAWIPLVRDWGGNNLAVDLSPGPTGTWGQVILFGRDYDIKYVVAKSWGAFIALVADDLNSGKWYVDEDEGDLKLREFKITRIEPSYFDILRWRMDQKYGRSARSAAKRKSMAPPGAGSPTASPYASPTDGPGELRGRSLQRLSNPSPLGSPARAAIGKSPLARVTESEEASSPVPLPEPKLVTNGIKPPKLVEVETPLQAEDGRILPRLQTDNLLKGKENNPPKPEPAKVNGSRTDAAEDGMKTIEI